MRPERLRRYLEILEETGYGTNGRNWDALDRLSDEELFDDVKVKECLQITEKQDKQPEEKQKSTGGGEMRKYSGIADEILFNRVNEILESFQSSHISGPKCYSLAKERKDMMVELRSRGYRL